MLEENLRTAAARGNFSDVLVLLDKGAKVSPDSSGRTPLHLAAAVGSSEILLKLIGSSDVNAVDSVGRTALQIAATGGHVEAVEVLLKNGANPNIVDLLHGNSPLHEASWHGFSKTVALLLTHKADPHVRNSAGFYPLHLSCQAGHNQSCRELLLNGANPDVQNNYGDTSLHTSARYGHAGVARILISANCRVSEQNKNGDTALHIAAAMGRRKMTSILLEAGCDKSIRNKQYETAADIATRKDLNEIIVILQSVKKASKDKLKKKTKKNSETSDSDKREILHAPHDPRACGSSVRWSPYGCHYYPDPNAFPQPRLDSLPGEPLSKGEQYYLDLAGNIRKGPVGVGLTCYCANFLRDMETRLERNNLELKRKIKTTKEKLEERFERTEGLINEWLLEADGVERRSRRVGGSSRRKNEKRRRSHSVDLLKNTAGADPHDESSSPILPTPPRFDTPQERMSDVEKRLQELSIRASEPDANSDSANGVIEKLPFRSRAPVYSPGYIGLPDDDLTPGRVSH